jgi:hypothetical protein
MRRILFLILLVPFYSTSQDLPKNAEGKVEYVDVIKLDTTHAAALFSNAKIFITNAFKSGKDVTQMEDQEAKTVIGKGNMPVDIKALGMAWPGRVDFKITIQCKDGRYKYSFSDFVFNYQAGTKGKAFQYGMEEDDHKGLNKKQWDNVKQQVDDTITAAVVDLKKQMASSSDW